jgi:hypothetical protein
VVGRAEAADTVAVEATCIWAVGIITVGMAMLWFMVVLDGGDILIPTLGTRILGITVMALTLQLLKQWGRIILPREFHMRSWADSGAGT